MNVLQDPVTKMPIRKGFVATYLPMAFTILLIYASLVGNHPVLPLQSSYYFKLAGKSTPARFATYRVQSVAHTCQTCTQTTVQFWFANTFCTQQCVPLNFLLPQRGCIPSASWLFYTCASSAVKICSIFMSVKKRIS